MAKHDQSWNLYGILRSIYADVGHSFGEYVAIAEGAIVVSSRADGTTAASLSIFLHDRYHWVLHDVIQPDPSHVSGIGFALVFPPMVKLCWWERERRILKKRLTTGWHTYLVAILREQIHLKGFPLFY